LWSILRQVLAVTILANFVWFAFSQSQSLQIDWIALSEVYGSVALRAFVVTAGDSMPDQSKRAGQIFTPLGADVLAIKSFLFTEELSAEFEYSVDLLSEDFEIDPLALLGQGVTVKLAARDKPRFFHGVVTDFAFTGADRDGTLATYQAMLRPWTWIMNRRTDCRIFQEMTAPEIIEQVVRDAGFIDLLDVGALSDSYPKREYCVQYNEGDGDFIRRLMEEEGIASFFTHKDGKHTLVLLDWTDNFEPMPGYEVIDYMGGGAQRRAAGEIIHGWSLRNSLTPGAHATVDYDFKVPSKDMSVTSPFSCGHKHDDREVFEWPGNFVERADGERYARIRREALQAGRERVEGVASSRGLSAGHIFDLALFPRADQNRTYLVLRTTHEFRITDHRSGPAEGETAYECRFACSDPGLLYRPTEVKDRPRIVGPQTAVVVGPEGEEIFTDEHGRIKVQFFWDRYGERDENSSCWIRVAQPWAGGNWGGQHIPRIGQEVLIEFLEGDPDRPLCTGAVYNGENMAPFSLPENKTQSGIRSNSTIIGENGLRGANQLLFEDETEKENIFVHAQKDYTERVLNTRTSRVDSHDVRSIGDNEYISVGKASHRHVGNTSVNIVGGTGPAATVTAVAASASFAVAVKSIATAKVLPGTSPTKATGIAALGILGGWAVGQFNTHFSKHLDPNFLKLTEGEDPIEDAGRDLITAGQNLGDNSVSAPIALGTNVDIIGAADLKVVGGAKLDVIGAYKIDFVGVNHVENIGFNSFIKIGETQNLKIGKVQTIDVGEEQHIVIGKERTINVGDSEFKKIETKAQMQVGKEYKILAGEKFIGESKTWEIYADKKIKLSAPGGYIEITDKGILIRGKKVKIEGNRVDFKKKSGGKGTACLKGMAKTVSPFVN